MIFCHHSNSNQACSIVYSIEIDACEIMSNYYLIFIWIKKHRPIIEHDLRSLYTKCVHLNCRLMANCPMSHVQTCKIKVYKLCQWHHVHDQKKAMNEIIVRCPILTWFSFFVAMCVQRSACVRCVWVCIASHITSCIERNVFHNVISPFLDSEKKSINLISEF